jgi:hypothetical protein
MRPYKLKILLLVIFSLFPVITVFAQQKKAEINLQLTINPTLYYEIKDGRLLIESNSNEKISVYGDDRLIYSAMPSSGAGDVQLSNYSSYSFFTIIPAI